MSTQACKPFRTIFVAELLQESGLSTGGRDEGLQADAIVIRDGLNRPLLRGSGLAGALLSTLDDMAIDIPIAISRRLPKENTAVQGHESLWLVHHAHLQQAQEETLVRPHVAIHSWTGAAVDSLKFDTEYLPRGTRWRLLLEVDDWRDKLHGTPSGAASLLARALRQWQSGYCWLGRSPARGLGWAKLEGLQIYQLDSRAVLHWPDANQDDASNSKWLSSAAQAPESNGVNPVSLAALLPDNREETSCWQLYTASLQIGENTGDDYGLDTLSTTGRDMPTDKTPWHDWCREQAHGEVEGSTLATTIEPDSPPAWTYEVDEQGNTRLAFMIPGSALRGAMRSALAAHWRRCGIPVWAPNALFKEKADPASDPLLALFGSIEHDSNLLISDAYPLGAQPGLYLQQLHAEDEFTQGVYGSALFNRPCLVSGSFEFRIALRKALDGKAPGLDNQQWQHAQTVLGIANKLGERGLLPFGGAVWRGHGWIKLRIQDFPPATSKARQQQTQEASV